MRQNSGGVAGGFGTLTEKSVHLVSMVQPERRNLWVEASQED